MPPKSAKALDSTKENNTATSPRISARRRFPCLRLRSICLAEKNAARHEIFGGIEDFCEAAKRLTRFGGSFYAVYRPDRLTDIISAMRNALLEPKRVTFVHADTDSSSSIVLIEARRGGGSGLELTKPLIIYEDSSHKNYTSDMKHILDVGRFPTDFYNKQRG